MTHLSLLARVTSAVPGTNKEMNSLASLTTTKQQSY